MLEDRRRFIERLVSIVIMVYPLTAVPQIVKIWVHKEATGVSALTWLLFLVLIIPLITYSIIQREWKLTVMWSVWSVIYVVIIVGTLMYG